tara:strand:+ start:1973 stop:2278 length:306 start_codon:yes stop_codon:yes gene_type:complete
MEISSQKVIQILQKIIALIERSQMLGSDLYWRDLFVYILNKLNAPHELDSIARTILKAYGGMGTLSDYWIEKDGKIMEEDKQLQELLNDLCIICQNILTKK